MFKDHILDTGRGAGRVTFFA